MRRALTLSLTAAGLVLLCACRAQPVQTSSPAAAATPLSSPPPAVVKIMDGADPPVPDRKPELKRAWAAFTSDGRFRLARADDMRFSEPAKFRISQSFSQWQGDITFGDELAVLVVDNTRSAPDRFGVVIFRPVESKGKPVSYTPHWLWRERDLSNTALDRVSGYLFIHEFADGAVYKSCEVKWRERAGRYACAPM